jgi:hypothetical protein
MNQKPAGSPFGHVLMQMGAPMVSEAAQAERARRQYDTADPYNMPMQPLEMLALALLEQAQQIQGREAAAGAMRATTSPMDYASNPAQFDEFVRDDVRRNPNAATTRVPDRMGGRIETPWPASVGPARRR